jgi:hypothetical protein
LTVKECKYVVKEHAQFDLLPESVILKCGYGFEILNALNDSFPVENREMRTKENSDMSFSGIVKVSTSIIESVFTRKYGLSYLIWFENNIIDNAWEGLIRNLMMWGICLPKEEFKHRINFLKNKFNLFSLSLDSMVKLSKLISASANKYNTYWTRVCGNHNWLINLENIVGYISDGKYIGWNIYDEVVEWVEEKDSKLDKIPNYRLRMLKVMDMMYGDLKSNISMSIGKNLERFVSSRYHFTGGILAGVKINYDNKETGKVEKCRVKKNAVFLVKSPEEIMADMLSDSKDRRVAAW